MGQIGAILGLSITSKKHRDNVGTRKGRLVNIGTKPGLHRDTTDLISGQYW